MTGEEHASFFAVGQKFRELRTTNNYTQEQLAEYLGVDRTMIAKFENGERNLGVSILEKACRLFGCKLSILSTEEEYRPLTVAYRAKELTASDLDAIGRIQQLVLNMRVLKELELRKGRRKT